MAAFHRIKDNTFVLQESNNWSFGEMSEKVIATIRNLKVIVRYATASDFLSIGIC